MYKLEKKCFNCPVRKYALKSIVFLRKQYENQEQLFDLMDDFECNILDVVKDTREVLFNERN